MTLAVDPQSAAGFLERGLEPDTGKHVEQPAIRTAVTYVVGRDDGYSRRVRKRCELAIKTFLACVRDAAANRCKIVRTENSAETPAQLARILAANKHA